MKQRSLLLAPLLSLSLVAGMRATYAQGAPPKPAPVVQSFVAAGPSGPADLQRLRSALEKVRGVTSVEVQPGPGGARIAVKGDVLYTLLDAAARPLGYRMQITPVRFYAARGSGDRGDLARLRETLTRVPGVDRVALGQDQAGLAVRVGGIAPAPALHEAAKAAGYTLRQVGAYVASGSYDPDRLEKLRDVLAKVPGVEQVEMARLIGGATLLVYGDVADPQLIAAAKGQGYTLAAIRNAAGRRAEFAVGARPGAAVDEAKLKAFALGIEGVEAAEVLSTLDGPQLVLTGDRLKPERIVAAAAENGFDLQVVENVSLPSLTPKAGRVTPAAYEDAVNEDPIEVGKVAPDFALLSRDGATRIRMSDSAGKRPVVLIFGSCT